MKLLVIGAQGQIARSLAEVAIGQQLNVITMGRPQLDLLDPHSIRRVVSLVEPQVVINAAAYTAVDKAEEESDLAYALNRDGARRVAEVCAATNIPLIHISTDYVFDGRETSPKSETDRAVPLNTYGLTKLAGEFAVASAFERHVILRTAWVYSPFASNFVKTILGLAKSRPELNVVNDQIGNPTYAPHLAVGILEIGRRVVECINDAFPWGIYHLTGSGEASWYQLAREILDRSAALGGPMTTLRTTTTAKYPTKAPRPADSRLNSTKCCDTFGVRLPDWREGVADCVYRLLSEVNLSTKVKE